jgi:hypothetical protein
MQKKLGREIGIKEGSRKREYALGETLQDKALISFSVSYREKQSQDKNLKFLKKPRNLWNYFLKSAQSETEK